MIPVHATLPRSMTDPVMASVLKTVSQVFARKGVDPPADLGAATALDGSLGLDSLDLVDVVAALEGHFGFDPFATRAIDRLDTLADLADLYRRDDGHSRV
jgi:acyl carrier protein